MLVRSRVPLSSCCLQIQMSPAPCLPTGPFESLQDDHGLNLRAASQPQLIVFLCKNFNSHGVPFIAMEAQIETSVKSMWRVQM